VSSALDSRPLVAVRQRHTKKREGREIEREREREREREGGGVTDERNDSRRQRRGEGLTFPSLPR